MTSRPDPADVMRAADAVMEAYGGEDPQHALRQAVRAEDQAVNKVFARAVREEIEKRCLQQTPEKWTPAAARDQSATQR